MSETDIMRNIMVKLSQLGCICLRTNAGAFYTRDGRPVRIGIPGQSDLCGHRPDGKAFYAEIKKPGQKPRENQLNFLEAMRNSGAIAFWCDNVDDAVKEVFKDYG